MRIETADPTRRAPTVLLAYIRKHFGNVEAFANHAGLDRIKVQKAIRGEIERIDVDFAFAVTKATKGKVPAAWWVKSKAAA
jgi:hypothetical protein